MQYLIGVDIGTQSTRAAVMEESGRILTQASKETELIYEGDRWVLAGTGSDVWRRCGNRESSGGKSADRPPAGGVYLYGRANGGHYGNREKGRSGYAL